LFEGYAMNPFMENTVDKVETWACEVTKLAGREWGCKVVDQGSHLEIQFIGLPEVKSIKIPRLWLVTEHPTELRRQVEELVRAALPR
jgi:hypothetical protein